MTPAQLLLIVAVLIIILSLLASAAVLVSGYLQYRAAQQQDKSLLARLEQFSQRENK